MNALTRWLNEFLLRTGQDSPDKPINQLLEKLGLKLRPVRVRARNDR